MAQDLRIANALYNDVPSVSIPTQGGGSASFIDTSDANATAGDISTGKTAYVNGVKLTGTGTAGGTKYNCTVDDFLGDTDSSGQLQLVTGNNKDLVFSTVQSLAAYALMYKFYRNNALKSVEFPALTTCSTSSCMNYAFSSSTNILSASFPALTTISETAMQYAFDGCTKLQSVDLSALESVTGTSAMQGAFYGCTALESIDFSSLQIIGNPSAGNQTTYGQFNRAFYNCNKLTTLRFPLLEAIYCNMTAASLSTFYSNNKIQKLYFPKLAYIGKTSEYTYDTGANNIFYSCSALTEIHFALTNQSSIEASTGYATKWGAPSTCTIYFDL